MTFLGALNLHVSAVNQNQNAGFVIRVGRRLLQVVEVFTIYLFVTKIKAHIITLISSRVPYICILSLLC